MNLKQNYLIKIIVIQINLVSHTVKTIKILQKTTVISLTIIFFHLKFYSKDCKITNN